MEVLFVRRRLPALIPHQLSVTNVFEKNCGKYQSRGLIHGKLVAELCFFRLDHFAAECRRNLVSTQGKKESTYQKSFSSTSVVYGSQLWFIAELFLMSINRFLALISVPFFVASYHFACSVLRPICSKKLVSGRKVIFPISQEYPPLLTCHHRFFSNWNCFRWKNWVRTARNSFTWEFIFEFFSAAFF